VGAVFPAVIGQTETACFVIADISGYTGYLADVELDHAQDIIADLIDTVVRALRPPFRLAKLEGDAAFVYAVAGKIDGSLLQDNVEATYFAFRKRLRNIKQSSICECNACRQMPKLDLKFVAHHGEVAKQKMAGRDELVGRDVILVHRLLKNAVDEKLGGRAYALYSDACVHAMDIDPAFQGLAEHHETIDIIGDVKCWLRDLHEAWDKENARQRTEIPAAEAAAVYDYEIAAARPVVWEHITAPGHRPKWQGSDAVIEKHAKGRRGVGTQNHCMHGKDAIVEDILDWQPFDYITFNALMPIPGAPKVMFSYVFGDRPGGGTRLSVRVGKVKPKDQKYLEEQLVGFAGYVNGVMTNLRLLVEGQAGAPAVVEEPELLPTPERFLTQPVTHRA
jgi:uncharacterized protein YndB with AHSA1/START domain